MTTTCSCGLGGVHIIARRETFDGVPVCLWSDGSLTWSLGRSIKGAWFNPKPEQRDRALRAGRLFLGEVCLVAAADVSELARAARHVADRGGLPGDVRARFHTARLPTDPRPEWVTLSADARGKATERVWMLPRLGAWSGHVVWDLGRGARRYALYRRIHDPHAADLSYEPTGIAFATVGEMCRWLAEHPPRPSEVRR